MDKTDFIGKRVVVLGLGIHGGGLAVTRWLVKHKAKVTVTDTKAKSELEISIKKLSGLPINYVLGKHPLSLLNECDMVIQNPGVPSNHPFLKEAQKKKIVIENEASLFLKLCPTQKIVAVTGTRGKSTTVSLIGELMKEAWPKAIAAGNIRDVVLFDVLDKLSPDTPVVVELSSWQLELVGQHKLRIPLTLLTNVYPDHLNRYKSFDYYIKAKSNIFRFQNNHDSVVFNYDNSVTRKLAKQALAKVYWFSLKNKVLQGCYTDSNYVYWSMGSKKEKLFARRHVKVIGEHNLANVLAAVTVAKILGIKSQSIKKVVGRFKGLHDRLQLIKELSGVQYYNDTTSTSPDACIAALKVFTHQEVILIAGGTDKSLPYKTMAKAIRSNSKAVILLPGTATIKLLHELKTFKKIFLARSMMEAVKIAKKIAPPKGVVLLSPGAASFGLFKHEFDRGQAFIKSVEQLK